MPDDRPWVKKLLTRIRPDAVLCSNDATAAQLMLTLQDLDRRVPADRAVAGFDDVRYAKLLSPALTTMRQPAMPARRILLRAELIVRASTAG